MVEHDMPVPTAGLRATSEQNKADPNADEELRQMKALARGEDDELRHMREAARGDDDPEIRQMRELARSGSGPLSMEAQIQRGGAVATPAPTREELSGKLQDVWTETFNAETRAGRPNDAERVAWDVVNSIRHVPAGDTRGKNFGAIAGGIGIPAPGSDPFEAAGVMAQQVTTPGSAANRFAEALSPRWFSEDTYGVQDTVGWRVAETQAERERAMNLRAANDIRAGIAPDEAKRAARERLNSGAALLLPTSANPDTAMAQADTPMEFATLPTTLRESAVDMGAGFVRAGGSLANTLKDLTVDLPGYAVEKVQGALGLDELAAGSKAVRDWTFPDPVDALIRYYESIPEDEMTPEHQADLMRLREGSFFTGMAGLHNAVVPDWVDPIDPRDAGLLNTVARVVTSKNTAQMPQVAGEDVVESITSTAPEAVKKYGEATEKFYGYLGGDVSGEDALSAAGSAGAAIGKAIKEPLSTGIGALSTTSEGRESTAAWWMRVGGTALSAPITTYAARVLDKALTSMGAESYRKHRVPWEDQGTGGGYAHALARKLRLGDTGHAIADWAEVVVPILDNGEFVQDIATSIWNGDSIMPETMRALDTLAKGTKWFSPETTASMQPGGNIYEIATTLGMIGDLALPMDGIVPHLVKEPLVRASRFTDGYLAGKMLAMPAAEAAKVGLAHSIPSVADRILRNNPEYVAAHAALSGQVDRPAAPGVSVFTGRDTDAPAVTNAAAMAWFKKQYALGRDPVEVLRMSEDPGHRVVADRMAELFTILAVERRASEATPETPPTPKVPVDEPVVATKERRAARPNIVSEAESALVAADRDGARPIAKFNDAVYREADPIARHGAMLGQLAAHWNVSMDTAKAALQSAMSYVDPANGRPVRSPWMDEDGLASVRERHVALGLTRLRNASPAQVFRNLIRFENGEPITWVNEVSPARQRAMDALTAMATDGKVNFTTANVKTYMAVADRMAKALVDHGVIPDTEAFWSAKEYQGGEADKPTIGGWIDFRKDANALVTIARSGDLSTLFHEDAHLLRRIIPADQMAAVDAVAKERFGGWNRAAEEWFATQMESVIASGELTISAKEKQRQPSLYKRLRDALDKAAKVVSAILRGREMEPVHPEFAKWVQDYFFRSERIRPREVVDAEPVSRRKAPGMTPERVEVVNQMFETLVSEESGTARRREIHKLVNDVAYWAGLSKDEAKALHAAVKEGSDLAVLRDIAEIANGRAVDLATYVTKATEPAAGPGGPVAKMLPEEERPTFRTSKGSVYTVNEDGTTSRMKAARAEHPGDFGLKEASQGTIYVDRDGLERLGVFQTQGGWSGKHLRVSGDEAAIFGVDGRGKVVGIGTSRTKVKDKPFVGGFPVEWWDDGRVVHFGNEIVEVSPAKPAEPAPAQAAKVEPAESKARRAMEDRLSNLVAGVQNANLATSQSRALAFLRDVARVVLEQSGSTEKVDDTVVRRVLGDATVNDYKTAVRQAYRDFKDRTGVTDNARSEAVLTASRKVLTQVGLYDPLAAVAEPTPVAPILDVIATTVTPEDKAVAKEASAHPPLSASGSATHNQRGAIRVLVDSTGTALPVAVRRVSIDDVTPSHKLNLAWNERYDKAFQNRTDAFQRSGWLQEKVNRYNPMLAQSVDTMSPTIGAPTMWRGPDGTMHITSGNGRTLVIQLLMERAAAGDPAAQMRLQAHQAEVAAWSHALGLGTPDPRDILVFEMDAPYEAVVSFAKNSQGVPAAELSSMETALSHADQIRHSEAVVPLEVANLPDELDVDTVKSYIQANPTAFERALAVLWPEPSERLAKMEKGGELLVDAVQGVLLGQIDRATHERMMGYGKDVVDILAACVPALVDLDRGTDTAPDLSVYRLSSYFADAVELWQSAVASGRKSPEALGKYAAERSTQTVFAGGRPLPISKLSVALAMSMMQARTPGGVARRARDLVDGLTHAKRPALFARPRDHHAVALEYLTHGTENAKLIPAEIPDTHTAAQDVARKMEMTGIEARRAEDPALMTEPQGYAELKESVGATEEPQTRLLQDRRQTETPEFKRWFGGSKVVDESGRPLVVYHGTPSADDFSTFMVDRELGAHFGTVRAAEDATYARAKRTARDLSRSEMSAIDAESFRAVKSNPKTAEYRSHLDRLAYLEAEYERVSSDPERAATVYRDIVAEQRREFPDDVVMAYEADVAGAEGGAKLARAEAAATETRHRIVPVYLSIANPVLLDEPRTGSWGDVREVMLANKFHPALAGFTGQTGGELVRHLERRGYDGVVYQNAFEGRGSTSYIAFRPEQIKSAVANVGTFDPSNPSILYHDPGEPSRTPLSDQAERDLNNAIDSMMEDNPELGPDRAKMVRDGVESALRSLRDREYDARDANDRALAAQPSDKAAANRTYWLTDDVLREARLRFRVTLENEIRKAKATPPRPGASTRTGSDAVAARLSAERKFGSVTDADARDAARLLEMLGNPLEDAAFRVGKRIGGSATALGAYDFANDVIAIAKRAFDQGVSTRTLAHEIGHRVSMWLPKDKAQALFRQYIKERRAAIKDHPTWFDQNGRLTPEGKRDPGSYRWVDIDEWFAERFADHAHKRLRQWDAATLSVMDAARFMLEKVKARILDFFGVDRVPAVVEDLMAGRLDAIIQDAQRPVRQRLIQVQPTMGPQPKGPTRLLQDRAEPYMPKGAKELREYLDKVKFIPQAELIAILGDARPEYLDEVAKFILDQRVKVREGRLTNRDVAKAYVMTTASQGAGARSVGPIEAIIGPIPSQFLVEGAKGQRQIRPEEAMAAWLFSPMGQRALDAIERGEFDADAWQSAASVRKVFGDDRLNNLGVFGEPVAKGAVTMQNIGEVTRALNEAGGDWKKIEKAVSRLNGIAVGKSPFIGHLLGFGEMPTLDVREIVGWLTGRAEVGSLTTKNAELARAYNDASGSAPLARAFMQKIHDRFKKLQRAKVSGTDLPDEVFGAIMHHWFWDALAGSKTTHEGLYEAMRLAQDRRYPNAAEAAAATGDTLYTAEKSTDKGPRFRAAFVSWKGPNFTDTDLRAAAVSAPPDVRRVLGEWEAAILDPKNKGDASRALNAAMPTVTDQGLVDAMGEAAKLMRGEVLGERPTNSYGVMISTMRAKPLLTREQLNLALGYRADQRVYDAVDLNARVAAYAVTSLLQGREMPTRYTRPGNRVAVPVTRVGAVRARALSILGDMPKRVAASVHHVTEPPSAALPNGRVEPGKAPTNSGIPEVVRLSEQDAHRFLALRDWMEDTGWADSLPLSVRRLTLEDIVRGSRYDARTGLVLGSDLTLEGWSQMVGAVMDSQSGIAPFRGKAERHSLAASLVWYVAQRVSDLDATPRDAGIVRKMLAKVRSVTSGFVLDAIANPLLPWEQYAPDMPEYVRPLYEKYARTVGRLPGDLVESLKQAIVKLEDAGVGKDTLTLAALRDLSSTLHGLDAPISVTRGVEGVSDLEILRGWLYADAVPDPNVKTNAPYRRVTGDQFVPHDLPRVTVSGGHPITNPVQEVQAHGRVVERVVRRQGTLDADTLDAITALRDGTLDEQQAVFLLKKVQAALANANEIGLDILSSVAGRSGEADAVRESIRVRGAQGIALDAYEAFYTGDWTRQRGVAREGSIEWMSELLNKAPVKTDLWVFEVMNNLRTRWATEQFVNELVDHQYVASLTDIWKMGHRDTVPDLATRAMFSERVAAAMTAILRGQDLGTTSGITAEGTRVGGMDNYTGAHDVERAVAHTLLARMGMRPDLAASRKALKGSVAGSAVMRTFSEAFYKPRQGAAKSAPVLMTPSERAAKAASMEGVTPTMPEMTLAGTSPIMYAPLLERMRELQAEQGPVGQFLAGVLKDRETMRKTVEAVQDYARQYKGMLISGGPNGVAAAALAGSALLGGASLPAAALAGAAGLVWAFRPRIAAYATNALGAILQGHNEYGLRWLGRMIVDEVTKSKGVRASSIAARATRHSIALDRMAKPLEVVTRFIGSVADKAYQRASDDIAFVDANGRVWTDSAIIEYGETHGLDGTQAKFESAEKARHAVDRISREYAPTTPMGQMYNAVAKFFGRHALAENYRKLYEANDTFFRYVYFTRGLMDGEAPHDALKRALNATFDYSTTAPIDRWVNSVFLFWMFQRRTVDMVLRSLVTNPHRVLGPLRFLRDQDLKSGYVEDNEDHVPVGETVPDYMAGRYAVNYLPIVGSPNAAAMKLGLQEALTVNAMRIIADVSGVDLMALMGRGRPEIQLGFNLMNSAAGNEWVSFFRKGTVQDSSYFDVPLWFVRADQTMFGGSFGKRFDWFVLPTDDPSRYAAPGYPFVYRIPPEKYAAWEIFRNTAGMATIFGNGDIDARAGGWTSIVNENVMEFIGQLDPQNVGGFRADVGDINRANGTLVPAALTGPRDYLGRENEALRNVGVGMGVVKPPYAVQADIRRQADEAAKAKLEQLRREAPPVSPTNTPVNSDQAKPGAPMGMQPDKPMGLFK